ncbi:hypothetical protein [Actinoplanes sp. NPDC051411]|uniref:hypothetical protein n=1 Tax=Actinoplanes sp. NPDC051411 TaxID=3155522 RepID=UPI003440A7B4
MTTEILVPDLRDIQGYMRHTGWQEYPPGRAGSLWSKADTQIGVPHNGEHKDAVVGVVERLAFAESRPLRSMAERIRHFRFDIAHLRAVNDFKIADSIPLEAGSVITNSARMMLRSSGTTSRGIRSEIAGSYSKIGDRVVQEARMGHTERGSFIIPVLVKLPEVEEPAVGQGSFVSIAKSAPEPFERRVMRTFAQSLAAVKQLVVEPALEPSIEVLFAIVERGVSREFCWALSRVLEQSAVSKFDTRFSWAESVQHSRSLPESVELDGEAHELVEMTADKLKVHKVEPHQVFSGKIVELRHNTGDAYGWIKVSTIRNNRNSEISVRLPADHYNDAVEWHRDARPVLVEGQIQRAFGQRATVRDPRRCYPVDETFLR